MTWVEQGGHWPAVLKPRRAKGSDGVHLCASPEEMSRAFHAVHDQVDRLGFRNETVLVQEFLVGREYVVDTVSHDGRHRLAALWAYGKPAPGFDTIGLLSTEGIAATGWGAWRTMLLAPLPCGCSMRWRSATARAICKVIVDADGPVLVEIGARLHGGPRPI